MTLLVVLLFLCNLVHLLFADTSSITDGKGHMISDNSDIPNVKPTATKGMIIDGGSGGSRLHIYTWKPRVFHTVPPPLSYPESNELWNGRIEPGIHTYANNFPGIKTHFAQLIDFAKMTLEGYEKEFGDYPIYFKATGGMRELDSKTREKMIVYIRSLLSDKSFCPFFFRDDFARVISGEEEAVFSWTATNFLMGTLLPNSQGLGVVENVNTTYGTLDLGGASTQIAFYVPSQDILEGLTKLQLGGQKQWNVYTKSFLQFGINSARARHIDNLVSAFFTSLGSVPNPAPRYTIPNDCFHVGYSEEAHDSTGQHAVDVTGPTANLPNQLDRCRKLLKPLMERELDTFCEKTFHGDCSLVGAYQPPVPTGKHGHFIGTSSYKYPWSFLMLPKTTSLQQMETQARKICNFNFGEINSYYISNNLNLNNNKLGDYLPYYCFLSAYVLTLLEDGYRFNRTQTLTVMDEVNGHKVGWALGAILYEINDLPWVLQMSIVEQHPLGFVMMTGVLGFLFGVAAAVIVYREIIEDHHKQQNPYLPPDALPPQYVTSSFASKVASRANSMESLQRTNTMELVRLNENATVLSKSSSSAQLPPRSRANSGSNQSSEPSPQSSFIAPIHDSVSGKPPSTVHHPQQTHYYANNHQQLPLPPSFQQSMLTREDRRPHSFALGSSNNSRSTKLSQLPPIPRPPPTNSMQANSYQPSPSTSMKASGQINHHPTAMAASTGSSEKDPTSSDSAPFYLGSLSSTPPSQSVDGVAMAWDATPFLSHKRRPSIDNEDNNSQLGDIRHSISSDSSSSSSDDDTNSQRSTLLSSRPLSRANSNSFYTNTQSFVSHPQIPNNNSHNSNNNSNISTSINSNYTNYGSNNNNDYSRIPPDGY